MFRSKKLKVFLLGLLASAGTATWVQGQQPMTLKECIQYGMQHHPLNVISDNEIANAKQQTREGLSAYLPQINGSVSFDDNLKRATTVIPAGTFSPQEIRVQFGNQYNTNAVVQLDQTIYNRSLLMGIKALDPLGDVAELNKAKNQQSLMYGAAMAYYQVQILREQQALLKENDDKFSKMEQVLGLQLEQGVIRQVDYDRVAVTLANIRSQSEVVDTQIEMAMNQLKNAIGMPLDAPFDVAAGGWRLEDAVVNEVPKPSTGKVLELKIMEKNLEMQEIDLRRRQAMYLPTLTGYARVGSQSFGNEFGPSFSNWFSYSSIGLKLNVPIWNSFRTSASIKQAELNLSSARANQRIVKANIDLQAQNAASQWMSAQKSLESNIANMKLAKSVLDVTQLQYEQGVASLSDYLNSDYGLKEAQTNYITALLRSLTARLEFERAQGTLDSFLLN